MEAEMSKELNIFYTSDIHGWFSATDYASGGSRQGGLEKCAPLFKKDGHTFIIDGGDTLQGSPLTACISASGQSPAGLAAELMNAAGYDFITLGNHDFNYGKAEIEKYLAGLNAVCLCANVSGIEGLRRTSLVTLENGLRIGLTGIVTEHVPKWEKPENLDGITIGDALEAASAAYRELKDLGAEITVCIYHGGFEKDPKTGRVLSAGGEDRAWEICEKLGFDILLTGHRHSPLEGIRINGTHCCQPPDKASSFIALQAELADDGKLRCSSALIKPGEKSSEALRSLLKPAEDEASVWLDRPVGFLAEAVAAKTHLENALYGSPLANFFNTVQLDATGADISAAALSNELRGFPVAVSTRDIVSAYIFSNTLKVLEIDRAGLLQALERCAAYYTLSPDGSPGISPEFLDPEPQHYNFDCFYGIEAVFDLRKPVGSRVLSIKYKDRELEPDMKLRLCVNSYRSSGAGGYPVYSSCKVLYSGQDEMTDLIARFIEAHPGYRPDSTPCFRLVY